MLARELRLYKQRFGTKYVILRLILEETTQFVFPLGQDQYTTKMPKATTKTTREEEPEEVVIIEGGDNDGRTEGTDTHGVVNPSEVRHHIQCMEEVIREMKAKIDMGEMKDVVKAVLKEFQETIKLVMPQMADANTECILKSIKDPTCMALRPHTDKTKGLLEDIMLSEDIAYGDTMARMVGDIKPLNYDQKDMIIELFDDLKVAHKRMACVSGRMSSLTKTLTLA